MELKLDTISMKKTFITILFIALCSCEKNEVIDVLPDIIVDELIDLNLPQYINLQTPSGWAYTSGGLKGIVVINNGAGNQPFKAFERACPNNDCNSPMTFDGSLKLKCSCDESEYSIIDGSPQTAGNTNFAREYRVLKINASTLNITNF